MRSLLDNLSSLLLESSLERRFSLRISGEDGRLVFCDTKTAFMLASDIESVVGGTQLSTSSKFVA